MVVVRQILDLVAKVATISGWLESGAFGLKVSVLLALVAAGIVVIARLHRRRATVGARPRVRRDRPSEAVRGQIRLTETHIGRETKVDHFARQLEAPPSYPFARGIVASDAETLDRFARGIVASERGGMDGSA